MEAKVTGKTERTSNKSPFEGVEGRIPSSIRSFFYYFACIFSLGLVSILVNSYPRTYSKCTMSKCSIKEAPFLVIKMDGKWEICPVKTFVVPSSYVAAVKRSTTGLASSAKFMRKKKIRGPFDYSRQQALELRRLVDSSRDSRVSTYRAVHFRGTRYVYDPNTNVFEEPHVSLKDIMRSSSTLELRGLSNALHCIRLIMYGVNMVDPVRKKALEIVMEELANPFYAFQEFSIILTIMTGGYEIFAGVMLLATMFSLYVSYRQRRRGYKGQQRLASSQTEVRVLRDGRSFICGSSSLVPGDIVELNGRMTVPCDMVLLRGSVEVDESSITGDSSPVTKVPWKFVGDAEARDGDFGEFDGELDPMKLATGSELATNHLLIGNTRILFTEVEEKTQAVYAVVYRTATQSIIGSLLRQSLNQTRKLLPYEKQMFQVVVWLSLGFCIVSGLLMLHLESKFSLSSTTDLIVLSLNLVQLAVSPVLPAALALAVDWSRYRIKRGGIYPMDEKNIVMFGRADCFCFDKTGTLTTDRLKLHAVRPVRTGHFMEVMQQFSEIPEQLLLLMASCHSLKEVRGELVGDPMDISILSQSDFNNLDANLIDDDNIREAVQKTSVRFCAHAPHTFVRTPGRIMFTCTRYVHPFSSVARRSTAVVEVFSGPSHSKIPSTSGDLQREKECDEMAGLYVFSKGSPMVVAEACAPETVPGNLLAIVDFYALHGYRVIGSSMKKIEVKGDEENDLDNARNELIQTSREKLERDMQFLGLFILENTLHAESTEVVKSLMRSHLRPVLVTGDLANTAIAIGRATYIIYPRCSVFLADAEGYDTDDPKVVWKRIGLTRTEGAEILEPVVDYQELAMTGRAFEVLRANAVGDRAAFWQRLLCRVRIFAEMKPHQKGEVVEDLRALGHTVAFIGDGSNDAIGFSAADASCALSEKQSAVCAKFVGPEESPSAIIKVVREGRCTLASTMHCLKFLILCSFIQFVGYVELYRSGIPGFSQSQKIWMDAFTCFPLPIFMSIAGAYPKIARIRPPMTFTTFSVMSSVVGEILIQSIFSLIVVEWSDLKGISDHENVSNLHDVTSVRNTILFVYLNFQYLIIAFVFSISRPFRKPLYRNVLFFMWMVFLVIMDVILLNPDRDTERFFNLKYGNGDGEVPPSFRFRMLLLAVFNFLVSYLFEAVIISLAEESRKRGDKRNSRRLYHKIDARLTHAPHRIAFEKAKNVPFGNQHKRTTTQKRFVLGRLSGFMGY
eukprot:TRINITY_DN1071_c1_g1_i2.p1 TRINITY_DN1071_c1_g1~~TRINITY_DN1071_c1_g1_i2.p1  ORF type:complete len:1258 (+),score=313.86 TRINITY_DN1071_c1_g1_i2:50-3775(+)